MLRNRSSTLPATSGVEAWWAAVLGAKSCNWLQPKQSADSAAMESLGVHQSNQSGCQRTEFGVTLPAIATCRVSLRIGVLQRYQGQPFGLRPTGLRLLVQIGLQICSSGRLWPFKGMSIVPGLRSPMPRLTGWSISAGCLIRSVCMEPENCRLTSMLPTWARASTNAAAAS